ncbi:MAG: hypothetical protein MHM6MM_004475 [Cercozoa sp. M6MM]
MYTGTRLLTRAVQKRKDKPTTTGKNLPRLLRTAQTSVLPGASTEGECVVAAVSTAEHARNGWLLGSAFLGTQPRPQQLQDGN